MNPNIKVFNENLWAVDFQYVGMNYIRSDPYAGMAALYYYLYCDNRTAQILLFPNISVTEWNELGRKTKTYRMFKEFGDAILFQDGLLLRDEL